MGEGSEKSSFLHWNAPAAFLCPIGAGLMKDPVILVDSFQTAERCAVKKWFALGNQRCPVTNVHLKTARVIPNVALWLAIEQWKKSKNGRIPSAFFCPVTKLPMDDPVIIMASAQTISRAAAVSWSKSGSMRCPVTGSRLKNRTYMDNLSLRSAYEEWLENKLETAADCRPSCSPRASERMRGKSLSQSTCSENASKVVGKVTEQQMIVQKIARDGIEVFIKAGCFLRKDNRELYPCACHSTRLAKHNEHDGGL